MWLNNVYFLSSLEIEDDISFYDTSEVRFLLHEDFLNHFLTLSSVRSKKWGKVKKTQVKKSRFFNFHSNWDDRSNKPKNRQGMVQFKDGKTE